MWMLLGVMWDTPGKEKDGAGRKEKDALDIP